jgi:hypothetical protein
MSTVRIKRGKKEHYVHKLKEKDGSSKLVHLGTNSHSARKRLIHLKNERIETHKGLFSHIDKTQRKLNKIAEYNKSGNHKVAQMKKSFYTERMMSDLIEEPPNTRAFEQSALLIGLIFGTFVFLFSLFSVPTITGQSVSDVDIDMASVISTPFAGLLITTLLVVVVCTTFLHLKFHVRHNKTQKHKKKLH